MIQGIITGQAFKLCYGTVAGESIDYLTGEFDFSPGWEGYQKWVHFRQGSDDPIEILLEGDKIPAGTLSLSEGIYHVWLHGNKGETRITTEIQRMRVKPTGSIVPLAPISPSDAEQIAQLAQRAVDTANKVAQDAANGEFDGGYYTVSVSIAGDQLTFRFTASEEGMVPIPDQTVTVDIPGADPADIARAVEEYLTAHPVQAPVTSVNSKTGDVTLTAKDVQAVGLDQLPQAINDALAEAKASGAFKGGPGQDGPYYIPDVQESAPGTVDFAFTGSKPGMVPVGPFTVQIPSGSGSSLPLLVVEARNGLANHNGAEIISHLQAGGETVLHFYGRGDSLRGVYFPVSYDTDEGAVTYASTRLTRTTSLDPTVARYDKYTVTRDGLVLQESLDKAFTDKASDLTATAPPGITAKDNVQSILDALAVRQNEGDVIDVDAELKQYMTAVKPELVAAINEKGGAATQQDAMGELPGRIRTIPNGVSPAENLPAQTTLSAAEAAGAVTLKWQDTGAAGYAVIKKMSATPQTPADGTEVYRGPALSCTDTVSGKNVTAFYRIYPYNGAGQYQAYPTGSIAEVRVVDRSGQKQIGTLQLEDVIVLGTWEGQPLRWRVKDTLGAKHDGIIAIGTENALFNAPFDAPENDPENPNPVAARKSYGANRWAASNVRQWLNSAGLANEWFTPQHKYDVCAVYKNRDGFLRCFSPSELSAVVTKRNKSFLADADGGGYETTDDKFWLVSSFEAGLDLKFVDGDHVFDGMATEPQRKFESNYWTRTINATDNPGHVRFVNSSGGWSGSSAYSNFAFRPFCQLPSGTYVRWSDELSAYILADASPLQVTV